MKKYVWSNLKSREILQFKREILHPAVSAPLTHSLYTPLPKTTDPTTLSDVLNYHELVVHLDPVVYTLCLCCMFQDVREISMSRMTRENLAKRYREKAAEEERREIEKERELQLQLSREQEERRRKDDEMRREKERQQDKLRRLAKENEANNAAATADATNKMQGQYPCLFSGRLPPLLGS